MTQATESKGKIVLAYSGGLDTSVAIPWLEDRGYEVITMTVDVGQQVDLDFVKNKALNTGATTAYVMDLREEFITDFAWPALKANGMYQGTYPLSSALSRPLIARELVRVAEAEGAVAIAHGCTGKGQDQVRIEVCAGALNPNLIVEAPVRDWGFSRETEIEFAEEHNIPVPATKESPYSIDENMWGRAIECGVLEDPWNSCPEDAFKITVNPVDASDTPITMEITFEAGVPVAIDGVKMSGVDIIYKLRDIGGAAGVGRIDMIEDRLVGFKSREVYECPASIILINAHKALETLTLNKDVLRVKKDMDNKFAELAYEACWYSPLMDAISAFIDNTQLTVCGTVRMQIYKGQAAVMGMKSEKAIYREEIATYSECSTFDQNASVGFIKVWGLPIKTWTSVNGTDKLTGSAPSVEKVS